MAERTWAIKKKGREKSSKRFSHSYTEAKATFSAVRAQQNPQKESRGGARKWWRHRQLNSTYISTQKNTVVATGFGTFITAEKLFISLNFVLFSPAFSCYNFAENFSKDCVFFLLFESLIVDEGCTNYDHLTVSLWMPSKPVFGLFWLFLTSFPCTLKIANFADFDCLCEKIFRGLQTGVYALVYTKK